MRNKRSNSGAFKPVHSGYVVRHRYLLQQRHLESRGITFRAYLPRDNSRECGLKYITTNKVSFIKLCRFWKSTLPPHALCNGTGYTIVIIIELLLIAGKTRPPYTCSVLFRLLAVQVDFHYAEPLVKTYLSFYDSRFWTPQFYTICFILLPFFSSTSHSLMILRVQTAWERSVTVRSLLLHRRPRLQIHYCREKKS